MKNIIYSVNIGGYDYFNNPKNFDPNIRYILFTDNKYFKSDVWEVNHVDFLKGFSDRKKSRYIKLNPHKVLPNHDVSLWLDHNFTPNIINFENFLNKINFKNFDIMLYKHRFRNCLTDEASKVVLMKKDSKEIVDQQIKFYLNDGFPKNYGLFETGFMVRNNNSKMQNYNSFWWDQVNKFSERDQLSQTYVSWKLKVPTGHIPVGKSAYENEFLYNLEHLKEFKVK